MRFLHLSDLHLGKRVNEFSMLEDQAYILKEILNIIDEQKVEAVLIAGDVYDKVIPSAEAVRLLDDFLTRIAARELPVFLISGNLCRKSCFRFKTDEQQTDLSFTGI